MLTSLLLSSQVCNLENVRWSLSYKQIWQLSPRPIILNVVWYWSIGMFITVLHHKQHIGRAHLEYTWTSKRISRQQICNAFWGLTAALLPKYVFRNSGWRVLTLRFPFVCLYVKSASLLLHLYPLLWSPHTKLKRRRNLLMRRKQSTKVFQVYETSPTTRQFQKNNKYHHMHLDIGNLRIF